MWRGRLRELLSDGEHLAQLFATMLADVDDVLEQCRLDTEDAAHLLTQYGEGNPWAVFPGTAQIAERLDIKHPVTRDRGATAPWIPTTDLVIIFRNPHGIREALAVAFKPKGWEESRRTSELLSLEQEYWAARSVPWLLVTPTLYDYRVPLTLRRIAPWGLGEAVSGESRQVAARVARELAGHSVTSVLNRSADLLGNLEVAQRALWQAVWLGELPVDLRRGWRPQIPLRFISHSEFSDLNPIASRRSAWN